MGSSIVLKGLDKFGQLIVTRIKDGQLDWLELAMEDRESDTDISLAHPLIQKLKSLDEETKNIIRATVAVTAIAGIHDFLYALEDIHKDGDDDIAVLVNGENVVDLSSDGLNYDVFFWDEYFSEYLDVEKAQELEVGKKPGTDK